MVYGDTISYIHKDLSFLEIDSPNIEWEPFEERIYDGFNNGVYWFKVECSASYVDQILTIPESHITRASLYLLGNEIDKLSKTRYACFKLKANEEKRVYFLRVNCLKEARIPIEIKTYEEYHQSELNEYIIIGLYCGIVLSILLFNLFSYFSFNNKMYLHYMFMVLGMSANAIYKDGLIALLFGIEGINEVLEPPINAILVISCIFFTSSYLNLNNKLKKLKILGVSVIGLSIIANIGFLVTNSFLLFSMTAIFHLLALDIYWSAGVILWKKSYYAKFFALAYGVPLLFAHDYYISPHFGIAGLGLQPVLYKIGSIFEMVIFTYAIMYQAKKIARENTEIRLKLIDYTLQIGAPKNEVIKKELSIDQLVAAYNFTLKEITILKDVALEKSNKKIAVEHFISENTVKYHIKNILQKFEVKNRKAAGEKFLNK
jgi:DNA-binding CsgD family transcriptional regulator